jgi:hypothetical protein
MVTRGSGVDGESISKGLLRTEVFGASGFWRIRPD